MSKEIGERDMWHFFGPEFLIKWKIISPSHLTHEDSSILIFLPPLLSWHQQSPEVRCQL